MDNLFILFIGAFLVNNIVLIKFLGLCPFIGISNKVETSLGMGMAVIFVMTMASWITYPIYYLVLAKYNLVFLRTAVFILVIASLVQFVEMFLKKFFEPLYSALGIYLPLITTNCAILGVAFLNIDYGHNFIQVTVYSIGVGMGFTLALLLMASIRERLELANVPGPFKGAPIAFITAGLMSLAFLGFSGLI